MILMIIHSSYCDQAASLPKGLSGESLAMRAKVVLVLPLGLCLYSFSLSFSVFART